VKEFPTHPPRLQIQHLSKSYRGTFGQIEALVDISLDASERDFVCIVGQSGCGKSTLLQILAGFENPTSGQVLLDSMPVTAPSPRLGVVFQQPSLLPWLTAEKNIGLGLAIRKRPQLESVARFVALVGLKGFELHYPSQLSGGMAQRVAIARALVNEPDVILLDEPFGALDAFTRLRMQDELVRIWEEGCFTAIFVTHDIDEAIFLGTRIVALTPRPGRVARIYNIGLRRPRNRASSEFFRLKSMISHEFISMISDQSKESPS
jgi:sulfonate transport system ATP-binding protein